MGSSCLMGSGKGGSGSRYFLGSREDAVGSEHPVDAGEGMVESRCFLGSREGGLGSLCPMWNGVAILRFWCPRCGWGPPTLPCSVSAVILEPSRLTMVALTNSSFSSGTKMSFFKSKGRVWAANRSFSDLRR